MALAGLVLGYSGIAIIPIVLIVAAIAIPNLLRAKMAANEASAVARLQLLNAAVAKYEAANGKFPLSLREIGPTWPAAAGRHSGYIFDYQLIDVETGGKDGSGYTISANPATYGSTGRHYFFIDQTGVVRKESEHVATADSPPIN